MILESNVQDLINRVHRERESRLLIARNLENV